MADLKPESPLQRLAEPFRQALADVISQTLASWTVAISDQETPASSDAPLCFAVSASGAFKGNAAFELRSSDALLLAQKLRSESAESSAELNAEHKQAVEDFLRKVVQAAATKLKAQLGEGALQLERVEATAWRGAGVNFIASEGATTVSFKLQFDSEFLAIMQPPSEATVAGAPEKAPPKRPQTGDSHLDLLLGVDLSLTLRFGQRTLTLREILDLSSGSIIELDRQVQEPADLLLGDKLIARGEVVIVDGNYGLRITEVTDPQHAEEQAALSTGR